MHEKNRWKDWIICGVLRSCNFNLKGYIYNYSLIRRLKRWDNLAFWSFKRSFMRYHHEKPSICRSFEKRKVGNSIWQKRYLDASITLPYMKGGISMILFILLTIILLFLIGFIVISVAIGGGVTIIIFGDVIVCIFIIVFLLKKLISRKKK